MFNLFRRNPDDLLKQATAHRDAGRFDNAITTLRDAYAAIAKGDVSYPVETYLRLPLYLQDAGRPKDAWAEFNRLLKDGYHLMSSDPSLVPMFHSTIYDKMRLFLQRQGEPLLAVAYGLASHYSWALGLQRQRRTDELRNHLDPDGEREKITKLLKKAKATERAEALLSIATTIRESISRFSAATLIEKVCGVLNIQSEYGA